MAITNILDSKILRVISDNLSPTHFVSNVRHQHQCYQIESLIADVKQTKVFLHRTHQWILHHSDHEKWKIWRIWWKFHSFMRGWRIVFHRFYCSILWINRLFPVFKCRLTRMEKYSSLRIVSTKKFSSNQVKWKLLMIFGTVDDSHALKPRWKIIWNKNLKFSCLRFFVDDGALDGALSQSDQRIVPAS